MITERIPIRTFSSLQRRGTPREVVREFVEFVLRVRRALVDIGIVAEIIVVDRDALEQYRNCTGYVYHYALSEGVTL